LKELNETDVWLRLIVESSLLSPEKMSGIVAENDELCRIIAASIKTAGALAEMGDSAQANGHDYFKIESRTTV
jgi:hypothetical protein